MEQQKNIAAKLVQVMQACAYIQKDSENKEQRYRYVSAAAVLEKVNQALVNNRLVSIPEFSIISEKEKPTAKGGVWQLVNIQCRLQIIDADSGESITVVSLGTGTDPGDKATAKAQTMALKYAWLTALCIETGDEPSADERTDQQVFGPAGAVQGPPGPPVAAAKGIFDEICQLWQHLGWNIQMLPDYIEKRFQKSVSQLTDNELSELANEARLYYQQRGNLHG